MLYGMPYASTMGLLGSPKRPMIIPFGLNHNGQFFRRNVVATRRQPFDGYAGRGAGAQRVALEGVDLPEDGDSLDLIALDESLVRLEVHDSLAANLVKLRYFAGLTMSEAAAALGVPLRTAERNWTYARTWLRRDLG
jgi:DNA-directed RNA polymerase specialized sigma24 family protein